MASWATRCKESWESKARPIPFPSPQPSPQHQKKKNQAHKSAQQLTIRKVPTHSVHTHSWTQRCTGSDEKGPEHFVGEHVPPHTQRHTEAHPKSPEDTKFCGGRCTLTTADKCVCAQTHMCTHTYKGSKTHRPGRMRGRAGLGNPPRCTTAAQALSPRRREWPPSPWAAAPQPAPAKGTIICPALSHINCQASPPH